MLLAVGFAVLAAALLITGILRGPDDDGAVFTVIGEQLARDGRRIYVLDR